MSISVQATVRPRVLFVDDETAVLDGIQANLRRTHDVIVATSGAEGLAHLAKDDSIQVVVSDMRMPVMDGAAFLSRVAATSPTTVRMLLTGQSDISSAMAAVNHGHLFRFLMKPCGRDELRSHLDAATTQHRLVRAERELLEQTLRGSIKVLVDVLAIASPAAFGRANRIKARVMVLANELALVDSWQVEIAALASQLGAITLPHELCQKLDHGLQLTAEEQRIVARAPTTTAQMLAHIPRLEGVRKILVDHVSPPSRTASPTREVRTLELGARLLRFALDLDELENRASRGGPPLDDNTVVCDPEIRAVYRRWRDASREQATDVQLSQLRPGMVLVDDVRLASGALLVARGYEITAPFIERVQNFPPGTLRAHLRVVGS